MHDVKLPPLPKDEVLRFGHTTTAMQAYARAAVLADREARWQPIETAPRDGSEFQAWTSAGWEPRCRFNPDSDAFEIWGRVDYDIDDWGAYSHLQATHWMPLPAPPQDNKD